MTQSERISIVDLKGKAFTAVRSTDPKTPKQWMVVDPVRLLSTEDDKNFVDGDGQPYSRV